MFVTLAKKVFGTANDRRLRTYRPKVAAINALEPELQALSDDALRARTDTFRAELAAGKGNGFDRRFHTIFLSSEISSGGFSTMPGLPDIAKNLMFVASVNRAPAPIRSDRKSHQPDAPPRWDN